MRKTYWALCCLLWMASGCQKNNRAENITPLNTGQWRTFIFSHEGNDLSAAMALAIYQFKRDGSFILMQPGKADTGLYFIRQIDGKNIVTIKIKDNPVITLLNKDWEMLELKPERVRMQNTVGNKTSLLTLVR